METNSPDPIGQIDYGLHYRNWHDESTAHVAQMVAESRGVLKHWLGPDLRGPCLDIGCGMGFAVLALKQLGCTDCSGIDTDPGQVAACKRLGANAECVTDSIAYLKDRPDSYQIITMFDLLEHVPVDQQVGLAHAAYGALAPGGKLLIQVPNANSPLASRWRYIDYTHRSSFTEHSLRFVLQIAKFRTIKIQGYEPVLRPSLRLWRAGVRQHWWRGWWRWALFKAWRKLIEAELGSFEKIDNIPLTLNMVGVAVKDVGEAL